MTINVNVPIRVDGRDFHPSGGTWPSLVKDKKTGLVKAVIGLKETAGGPTTRWDIMLPKYEFNTGIPGNLINFLLTEFEDLPVEGICVRVPFQKSEDGNYLMCTPEMLSEARTTSDHRLSFKAQSICHLQISKAEGVLTQKAGVITTSKASGKLFEFNFKGRRQHHPMPVPKSPTFFEQVYKSEKAGFYSMLTQALDGPIKFSQSTLIPELRPYNLMAAVICTAKYWRTVANNYPKGSFDVNLGFSGSPLNPIFEDDVLANIAASVRSYRPTQTSTPTPIVVPPPPVKVEKTKLVVGRITLTRK